ncbi:MAG: hypothetical protein COZ49_02560 [Candidatus Yonathbacteria bacterium CG_4_10_14_3_um_filter_47_65]|uniref:PD-(D/E)XK endonuclease-like domain-containing protein n=2 Tax=Parcubacteria group TaxID=1794811 RepID=A0A2M8D664_9BACT|nr:MAG: hypothetical protein AUJ44_01665 [Candidatus Nomurabacteria bacterium CG1_02_47_685]PIP03590.1 MAG: hypothetical protein COX54_03085 [Candidatus Yonathbacteria bacterium CG23_combo_of_CG06-09_8_20_14_all_46_18]PIQ31411.1 MAG: hypothetical protein COW61_03820 [Candidatus Yonathbacteria bacterium CG17_big_fil_post_rev_8_21_14_2_50_46_19]PIX56368.1 MAG: hypothetical protein COZ49_02560 [Candidatus Yonathbacteria bacterium CG_4_10_14_3_um_filter_47_65]PIY57516.1 MAG: hypothetical protein CO
MKTSYSALNTYKTCPLKYKYSQIDKLKEPKRIESVFGTIIHSALKFMFERNPLYPTLDEVIDFYTNKWGEKSEKVEWRNPEKKDAEEKMYFEEGVKILKNFYKKNQPWTFNVIELEGRFSFDLVDDLNGATHTISGIIDRIDKDPDSDLYEIIDYKTGKRMPPQKELESDLQLGIYHLALSSRWPQTKSENIKTTLYFLKHNNKVSNTFTAPVIGDVRVRVIGAIREIEKKTQQNDFLPTPGPLCGYCGFRKICPMWSHEYPSEIMTVDDTEAGAAIAEFFEIKDAEDQNKKRLAGLREKILSYMEDRKLLRVFSSHGYITKNVQERSSYDMEKAKDILEQAEMLDKVLSPDEKKLERILPSLPDNIREKLAAIKTTKKFFVLKHTNKKNSSADSQPGKEPE